MQTFLLTTNFHKVYQSLINSALNLNSQMSHVPCRACRLGIVSVDGAGSLAELREGKRYTLHSLPIAVVVIIVARSSVVSLHTMVLTKIFLFSLRLTITAAPESNCGRGAVVLQFRSGPRTSQQVMVSQHFPT